MFITSEEVIPSSGLNHVCMIPLHCLVFKEHPRLLFCRNTALLLPHLPSTYVLCTSRSGSSLRLVLQQNPFAINFFSEALASWVSFYIISRRCFNVKHFLIFLFLLLASLFKVFSGDNIDNITIFYWPCQLFFTQLFIFISRLLLERCTVEFISSTIRPSL